LIPAGTGIVAYKKLNVLIEGEEERFAPHPPRHAEPLSAVNEE